MQKYRIYIVQVIGIIMLMAGYILSDAPDSKSAMHFVLSDSHVIAPGTIDRQDDDNTVKVTFQKNETHHDKHWHVKKTMSKVVMPIASYVPVPHQDLPIEIIYSRYLIGYRFLYQKEINPPPPRMV